MIIELGIMAAPLSEQLAGQNYPEHELETLDRLAKSINLLSIHCCLTDAETMRARQRLLKRIKQKPKI
jgi:hypothetical protein